MADEVEKFQVKLEEIKKLKSQYEFKLQNEFELAKTLKDKLKERGYNSLEEAKNDFLLKKQDLSKKDAELDALVAKIKLIPEKQFSREQILSSLVSQPLPAIQPPVVESNINLKVRKEETISNIDMFPDIQSLI